jgi:hypothetical protein
MRIFVGGHVTIEPNDSNVPIYIAEVIALREDGKSKEQNAVELTLYWGKRATNPGSLS